VCIDQCSIRTEHPSISSRFGYFAIPVLGGGVRLSDQSSQNKRGSDCLSGDDSASEANAPKRTAKELASDLDG
jgi:hypothetical protein